MDLRTKIQEQASTDWINSGGVGIVHAKTGLGKMRIAAYCILKAYNLGWLKDGDKVQFYAEVKMDSKSRRRRDFLKDLALVAPELPLELEFLTYQSKCAPTGKMAIYDELDAVAEVLVKPLLGYSGLVLGLTATISERKDFGESGLTKKELLSKIAPIVFKYGFNDALADGITNEVKVYKVMHKLSFHHNLPITNSWTGNEVKYWEFWKRKASETYLVDREFSKRISMFRLPRFLHNLESKVSPVKVLLSRLEGKTIIFGRELAYLEKITDNVIKDSTYDELMAKFEAGEITHVASAKKIQRGDNVPEVKNIILLNGSKSSEMVAQLIGRSRLNSDRLTRVYVFVTEGTFEEEWYKSIFLKKGRGTVLERIKYVEEGIVRL